jgi:Protein of unknown function (DUF3626)
MERTICQFCRCGIPVDKHEEHQKQCANDKFNLLSDYQKCAVKYITNKSKIYCKENKEQVKQLWKKYGYDTATFDLLKDHIKNIPLIIHFSFDSLCTFFENDTKYRNCFEIRNHGRDSFREHVEDFLFNRIYGLVPAEHKVKYGCLNLYLAKHGVTSASGYGDAYMIVKNDVKDRVSFVVGDSFQKPQHIATFKYFDHILLSLHESTVNNMVKVISNQTFIDDTYPYVEAQIHGNVIFARDIECLMLPIRYKNNEKLKHIKHLKYDFF